jgi:hypothetical protein
MFHADDALAIPAWPELTRQFASKCGPAIDRLLEGSSRFEYHFDFGHAKAMTLGEAARARAIREVEAITERRTTAAAVARQFGALFEELCLLVGPDGAAKVFATVAECARLAGY